MGLRQTGDLLERRRARFAVEGINFDGTLQPSFIARVGYDRTTSTMLVRNGVRSYGYKVPEQVFNEACAARDPGKTYNAFVKGKRRAEVDSCPKCDRFYAAGLERRCPSKHTAPSKVTHEQNVAARERAREITEE